MPYREFPTEMTGIAMAVSSQRRRGLCLSVVVAALSGCSGGATPIGMSEIPQREVLAMEAGARGSWMTPEAKKGPLLYVGGLTDVYVYSYPKGSLVGTLTGFYEATGLCSDKRGNVWIANADNDEGRGYVVEYAHGGTTAIKMLTAPYISPQGCSVDPVSGDLAVASGGYDCCGSSLLIYPEASGTPAVYDGYGLFWPFIGCTYDNNGNVYVATGERFYRAATLWLPKGGSSLSLFPIYPKTYPHHGIQFDGTYLVTEGRNTKIFQNVLEGSEAHRHGPKIVISPYDPEYYWIQGSRILGTAYSRVAFWRYPEGGAAVKEFDTPGRVEGLTVSVVPRR